MSQDPQHATAQSVGQSTVRLHPVAGAIAPAEWLVLAHIARDFADGNIYLLKHACLELRGIGKHQRGDVEALLADTTLARFARPLLASPLSAPARALCAMLAEELEKAHVDTTTIGVDGGDGVIRAHGLGVCLVNSGPEQWDVEVEGASHAQGLSTADAVAATRAVLSDANLAHPELDPRFSSPKSAPTEPAKTGALPTDYAATESVPPRPIGWLAHPDDPERVDVGAGIYKGTLPAEHAELLGRFEVAMSITPWRGIIAHDLFEAEAEVVVRFLAPRGFIFDADSPLLDH